MSEWIETELGEYADLLSGYAFKSIDFEVKKINDEYLPVIKIKNVANGDVNLNDVVYHKKDSKLEKFINEKGDVLIAMTGNHPFMETQVVGSVSKYNLNEKSFLNQRVGKLFTKDEKRMNNDFLYYLLKVPKYQSLLASYSSGSASQANISKNDILGLRVKIPNIEIQNETAKTLYSLDSKISLLRQQNHTLEELAQTLFKRWFVDFEFPNENGEPYKSYGGNMIDSELGEIPEGWELKPLDDLVIVHNGYSYKGSELLASDVAMVTLKNFDRNGGFRFDGFKEIVSSNYKEKHIVQVGDLVVAHTDLTQDAEVLGNPAIIMKNDKYKELIISMDLVKVESKDPYINSEFLYFLMAEKRFKSHCKGYSNGTTVLHLSKNAIPEYLFPLPISRDFIVLFGNYAKTVYAKIVKNISEIQNVTNLRDTLLPKLMSGEIEIN